jgi:hypothetical protein
MPEWRGVRSVETSTSTREDTMKEPISRRTGIAAMVAGLSFFAGQGGALVVGSPSDTLDAVFAALIGVGLVAFGVALWGLRASLSEPRRARIGVRTALVGAALLALFAVQAVVEVLRTGDMPENFALFGLGFLLAIVGQLLFASALRPVVGTAWLLPIVGALGTIVALAIAVDPIHDIGLFVFEGAWVLLGATMLTQRRAMRAALA